MDEKDIEKKMLEVWNSNPKEQPQDEKEALWNNFASATFPKKKTRKKWHYASIAAVLMIALSTSTYLLFNTEQLTESSLAYTIIANPSTKIKAVFLPDSSVVELEPNAELRYIEEFRTNRHITLTGKAFFKVKKDKQHPFRVSCQETTTTVLGTSFTIDGNAKNTVEVSLYEGRVQMNVDDSESSWILAPGEQFIYKNDSVAVEAFDRFQDFNNTEVSLVLKYIQATYGYAVQMPQEYLSKKITLRLNKKEPLENVVGIMAQMSNLNPTIDDKLKKITFR